MADEHYSSLNSMDPARLAAAGLQGFFNITGAWRLSAEQQRTLLGNPDESTFEKWRADKSASELAPEILERISCILGIYKALQVLLPTQRAANDWIKKPNDAPLFQGNSALTRMMSGQLSDLYEVRRYLDSESH